MMLLSRRRRTPFALLLLVIAFGPAMPSTAQTTSGTIAGLVTDAQSAVLPGVTLTLRNAETGFTRTAVTEADGRYRLAGLPPGRYELRAELSGFAPIEVTDITLTIGLEIGRNITMQLQGVQESLTVTAQPPIVETTRTDVSGVITQQQIETLPLAGAPAGGARAADARHQPGRGAAAQVQRERRCRRVHPCRSAPGRRRVEQGGQHRRAAAGPSRRRPSVSSRCTSARRRPSTAGRRAGS